MNQKVYSKLINITKNNDNKFIKLKNLIGLIENKKIMVTIHSHDNI